jgi:DNA phosphorothioation-dependent restriction protein DptF
MSLKQMVEMLSKGSAQAVTTLRTANANAAKLKDYLYVKTPVEKALISILDETVGKRIVFLCGSSGDGKSEIFRRHHKKYSKFDFHLDATHSSDPAKDAIQTLNDKFAKYKATERPLVVGVNIGMLGNFAAEGADSHADIKTSIHQFLLKQKSTNQDHIFINFEEHPKFDLCGDKINAPFIAPLLERICAKDEKNPIYVQSQIGNQETNLHRNYRLLCFPEVQQRICSLLFYAHLKFDQFLTARTVLDFVYQTIDACDHLAGVTFNRSLEDATIH